MRAWGLLGWLESYGLFSVLLLHWDPERVNLCTSPLRVESWFSTALMVVSATGFQKQLKGLTFLGLIPRARVLSVRLETLAP